MKKALLGLFAICITASLGFSVHAQDNTAITVFPAVQDVQVKPGVRTRMQIQFRNGADVPLAGALKVADFIVIDKKGTPFLIEDGAIKPKYSASSWIKLTDDFISIPKGEIVSEMAYVNPPAELTACGYYAIVYFQPNNESIKRLGAQKESATAVTTKIGGLVNFINEGRTCNEQVSLNAFRVPTFLENGPINVSFDLLNTGDIHQVPKGTVIASDWFGRGADQKNIQEIRIFPERAKEYDLALGEKWMFGPYKIKLNASYGTTGKIVAGEATVWVLPWKIMLAVILALSLVAFLIISTYRKMAKKETTLEQEVEKEREEIEELKAQIKKRTE